MKKDMKKSATEKLNNVKQLLHRTMIKLDKSENEISFDRIIWI